MAKLRNSVLMSALVVLLGACSLIPPIDVGDDPFGVTGQTVDAQIATTAAIGVLSKTATGSKVVSFNNVSASVTPSQLLAKLNIQNQVTIKAANGVYPNTLTLDVNVNASLTDGGTPFTVSGKIGNVGLTKDAGCADAAESCTYTATVTPTPTELTFTGDAMTIIFGGAEPNTVTINITMKVTGSPADLADGSTITVKLSGEGATAKL
jgi:hypothetical protein